MKDDIKELIKEYLIKGIIIYCFIEEGNCPNCNSKLMKNEFGNYECLYCWRQDLINHEEYLSELLKKMNVE